MLYINIRINISLRAQREYSYELYSFLWVTCSVICVDFLIFCLMSQAYNTRKPGNNGINPKRLFEGEHFQWRTKGFFFISWSKLQIVKKLLRNCNLLLKQVQCVRKVAVHLKKVLGVMSTSVYTGLNPFNFINFNFHDPPVSILAHQLLTVKFRWSPTSLGA